MVDDMSLSIGLRTPWRARIAIAVLLDYLWHGIEPLSVAVRFKSRPGVGSVRSRRLSSHNPGEPQVKSSLMSRGRPFDWLEFIGWVAVIAGLIAIGWLLSLVMG